MAASAARRETYRGVPARFREYLCDTRATAAADGWKRAGQYAGLFGKTFRPCPVRGYNSRGIAMACRARGTDMRHVGGDEECPGFRAHGHEAHPSMGRCMTETTEVLSQAKIDGLLIELNLIL